MRLAEICKITSTDGNEILFHIIRGEIIPYSNFKIACEWYAGERLCAESKDLIEMILNMQIKNKIRQGSGLIREP
jgi:hypothetical protein